MRVSNKARTWASAAFHGVMDLFQTSPSEVLRFWTGNEQWTLRWLFHATISCDLAAVVSCSRHDRDLFMSILVLFLFYMLLQMLSAALGVPGLATYFLLSLPLVILWYVYGISLVCFPLLPPCLMDDIINAVERVLPPTITYPAPLLCNETQAGQAFIDEGEACFTPCSDLYFDAWTDPLAFALCDLDRGWCGALANLSAPYYPPLAGALAQKRDVLQNATADDLVAMRTCTAVTWITTIPALALVLTLILVAISLVAGVLGLGPSLVAAIAQTVVFHRTPDRLKRD
jgi:hypothetical protein